MQLNRITTVNPGSVLGSAPNPSQLNQTNTYQQGWDQQQARFDQEATQQKAEERQKKADAIADQDRQIKALEQMRDNPAIASEIARVNGIDYTPEFDALIKDRRKASLMTDAVKIAKDLGIDNPQASTTFVREYILSDGDFMRAQNALGGQQMRDTSKNVPKTTGLPQGMMWGSEGRPVPIPGVDQGDYFKGKWWQNPSLPPQLQLQLESYIRNPASAKISLGGQAAVDKMFQDAQAYMGRPVPGMENQSAPNAVQTEPQVPFGMDDKASAPISLSKHPDAKYLGNNEQGHPTFQLPDGRTIVVRKRDGV